LSADLVAGRVQFHGAETDPPLPIVEFLIDCRECDREISQRLFAVASRPPQRHIGDLNDECRSCGAGIHIALGAVAEDLGGHREWYFEIETLQLDPYLSSTGASGIDSHNGHHPS
jgi:hypothetical protein